MVSFSLMTVMAHPDDAELWAGGTITRHVHHGGSATIAVAHHDPIRNAEAAAGAGILGAHLELLDEITPAIVFALLTRHQPDVVVTHPVNDIHAEHRRCAETLLAVLPDVVIATGRPHRVYHCDGYHNLDMTGQPFILPVIVDITEAWETKLTALRSHASQPIIDHFGPMADTLARLHGGRIGVTRAEAFQAVPILGRLPTHEHL